MAQAKGIWVVLALLAACNAATSPLPSEAQDAAVASRVATEGDTSDASDASDATVDGAARPPDATTGAAEADVLDMSSPPREAGAPDARQPAPRACEPDAADEAGADDCPPPLSMCTDDHNLVYFDWGSCVSRSCVWPRTVIPCPSSGICSQGACKYLGT